MNSYKVTIENLDKNSKETLTTKAHDIDEALIKIRELRHIKGLVVKDGTK